MRIAHLNVRSLTASFADFSDLVLQGDYDIIGLSETWLTGEIAPIAFACLPLTGYQLTRQDRANQEGIRAGGCFVYNR